MGDAGFEPALLGLEPSVVGLTTPIPRAGDTRFELASLGLEPSVLGLSIPIPLKKPQIVAFRLVYNFYY